MRRPFPLLLAATLLAAVGCAARVHGDDYTPAFEAERAWQGAWLAQRLALTA